MRNREYQPCIGCELTVCDSDEEMFEKPFPIDACWERFDRRVERDPWRVIVDRYVSHKKTEEEM